MITPNRSAFGPNTADVEEAEKTLRLIACLPAPDDLEDRLKRSLQEVSRKGRVLHWPQPLWSRGGWMNNTMMRSAAAAAIVLVVAGGGWNVYSRVQSPQTPKVIAMPRVSAPGGFQSAGAMRTPQTLDPPVLQIPVKAETKQATSRAPSKQKYIRRVKATGTTSKAARQPVPPPAN